MAKKFELMYDTAEKKNSDYATSSDPFHNFKQCERLGICSKERGVLVRISDKLSRATNLVEREGSVKDEAVTDTLIDMANYCVILAVMLEEKKS